MGFGDFMVQVIWDQHLSGTSGVKLLHQVDIWISLRGSWGVPAAWDPATRIATAAARIKHPQGTGTSPCDTEALNSDQGHLANHLLKHNDEENGRNPSTWREVCRTVTNLPVCPRPPQRAEGSGRQGTAAQLFDAL